MRALPAAALFALALTATAALPKSSVVCTPASHADGAVLAADPSCKFYEGVVDGASAWAEFDNTINSTGWADLRLHGNPNSKGLPALPSVAAAAVAAGFWRFCELSEAQECRCVCVATAAGAADAVTYFAMGYLEGYLTAQMMCDFTYNYETSTFDGNMTLRGQVVTFLEQSYTWTMQQLQTNTSTYWKQVR